VIEAVLKAEAEQRAGHLHPELHHVGDHESAGAAGFADAAGGGLILLILIMRVEKQYLTKEYVARLNASPFSWWWITRA
jgi:hypothetical protein